MKVTSVACDWQGRAPQSGSYSGENYSQSRSSDGARPADTQGPKPVATITTGDEYIDSLRGRALDVCKHHVTKMPYEFVRLATDIAGGLPATAPPQQDFDSQAQRIQSARQMQKELKKHLAKTLAGVDPIVTDEVKDDLSGCMARVFAPTKSSS